MTQPLSDHRVYVLEYLRGIALPFTSVAGTIIEERVPADAERELLRPSLVLWACTACGGDRRDAVPVAAAFDLFDRFMLLHDELVGAPSRAPLSISSIERWGLGQSLNAGDALYALALRTLAEDVVDAERRLRVASLVAAAILDAIEGRNDDAERSARGQAESLLGWLRSVRRRSAALTGAALSAGALVAGAPERVVRGFDRGGRLLDVAAALDDASLSRRLSIKALAAVERCIPDRSALRAFEEAVASVAAPAA